MGKFWIMYADILTREQREGCDLRVLRLVWNCAIESAAHEINDRQIISSSIDRYEAWHAVQDLRR